MFLKTILRWRWSYSHCKVVFNLKVILGNSVLTEFYCTETSDKSPTLKSPNGSTRLPSPHPSWGVPGNPAQLNMPSTQHTGSSPCPKTGVMMRSIKMSYCCHHKGEPLRTDGSLWIIALTLTFLWRDQAPAYFHEGLGSLFQEYLFWFSEGTDRDLCSGALVAENASGPGR